MSENMESVSLAQQLLASDHSEGKTNGPAQKQMDTGKMLNELTAKLQTRLGKLRCTVDNARIYLANNNKLSTQNSKVLQENNTLKSRVAELEIAIQNEKSQKELEINKFRIHRTQLKDLLLKNVDSATNINGDYQADIHRNEPLNKDLENRYSEDKLALNSSLDEIKNLKAKVNKLRKEKGALLREKLRDRTEMEEKLKEKEAQIEDLTSELNKEKAKKTGLVSMEILQKKELEIYNLACQLKKLEIQNNNCQKEMVSLAEINAEYQAQIRSAEELHSADKLAINSSLAEIKNLKAKINQVHIEKGKQLREKFKDRMEQEEQLKEKTAQVEDLGVQLTSLRSENSRLLDEMKKEKPEICKKSARSALEAPQKECKKELELEELKSQKQQLEEKVRSLTKTNANLQAEIKKGNKKWEDRHSADKTAYNWSLDKLEKFQGIINQLKVDKDALLKEKAQTESEKSDLVTKVIDLEFEKYQHEEKVDLLTKQNAENQQLKTKKEWDDRHTGDKAAFNWSLGKITKLNGIISQLQMDKDALQNDNEQKRLALDTKLTDCANLEMQLREKEAQYENLRAQLNPPPQN